MTQKQVPLPDYVLDAVDAVIAAEGMDNPRKYRAVLTLVYGHALLTEGGDPYHFAIPQSQWERISAACTKMSTDPIDSVNWGLSWMNNSPSTYTEEVVGS